MTQKDDVHSALTDTVALAEAVEASADATVERAELAVVTFTDLGGSTMPAEAVLSVVSALRDRAEDLPGFLRRTVAALDVVSTDATPEQSLATCEGIGRLLAEAADEIHELISASEKAVIDAEFELAGSRAADDIAELAGTVRDDLQALGHRLDQTVASLKDLATGFGEQVERGALSSGASAGRTHSSGSVAGPEHQRVRWLQQHADAEELRRALEVIQHMVPDLAQRDRLMLRVQRPASLAKYLGRVTSPALLERLLDETHARGTPAGLSSEQWDDINDRMRPEVDDYGDDVRAQGSRAAGVPSVDSDLDLAILVDQADYNRILAQRFKASAERIEELRKLSKEDVKVGTRNAAERSLWYAIHQGKIARGELGLTRLGKSIAADFELPKCDISVILRGSAFDAGPWVPATRRPERDAAEPG